MSTNGSGLTKCRRARLSMGLELSASYQGTRHCPEKLAREGVSNNLMLYD